MRIIGLVSDVFLNVNILHITCVCLYVHTHAKCTHAFVCTFRISLHNCNNLIFCINLIIFFKYLLWGFAGCTEFCREPLFASTVVEKHLVQKLEKAIGCFVVTSFLARSLV